MEPGRNGWRDGGKEGERKGGREGWAAWERVCMAAPILAGMQVRRALKQVWVFCWFYFVSGIRLIAYFNSSRRSRPVSPRRSHFLPFNP